MKKRNVPIRWVDSVERRIWKSTVGNILLQIELDGGGSQREHLPVTSCRAVEEKCVNFLSEKVTNTKICVVSIIGKTSLDSSDCKKHIIAEALNRHIFQENEEKEKKKNCEVKAYYDATKRSMFLLMSGISDTNGLVNQCKEMENDLKVKSFLEVWSEIHYDFAKTLLMLFCMSHIIVITHPRATFDLSYVYLFRALDTMRLKAVPLFKELLAAVDISNDWLQNGRPCSPRVLFVFESSPLSDNNFNMTESRIKQKKPSPLKKLEHSLEDQIYRILRKSRVITNVSGNSLFAVPANQEFVYIFSSKHYIIDHTGFFLAQIRAHCQLAKESDITESKPKNKINIMGNGFNSLGDSVFSNESESSHSFVKFLFPHINLALTKGFDDNVGRYPVPAYFELLYYDCNSEEENSLTNEIEPLATDEQSQSQAEDERDEIVISIQDEITPSKERTLTRQPSTTEYLPGMLHSESKLGLLPMFSSWSLVCLGPSSLYSHNIGLQDQPGFIMGTNYLLPWDVTVKLEHKERFPLLWEGKRPLNLKAKKAFRDGPQFNVKIFIGVEYECYRGHRFMCSAPDRVLRVTSTGHVKDNASKITGSDMPLYFPCPCRSSKPQIAQLMRIHVVTPKAPVHITLHPKVQPAPEPCPIFFPTISEPLKLSQSAYWVLRLPFVYEGEHGPYLPPREHMPVSACRLLKGTYNIAEQQSSR
ncbi:protein smg8 [Trichonephila inaurata madagascariensis]|uniref:Nonsense-mediated mRNA decay factor SMG8 n=1 Tax=Trichonephila inaurata madagascariensis TaxID=2747483 RepID=A0A8X7C5L0_9ARAC|nr:protein smg8 [Trichonephila inaurata madagascariensis]